MSGRSATYATILPDDTGDDHAPLGYAPKRNVPAHQPRDVEHTERAKHNVEDQKQVPLNEREMLKKQITSNKLIVYGLLFVAAILMIALGYVLMQNRKLTTVDAPTSSAPLVMPGTSPPGHQMYEYPSTELPPTDHGGSSARATAQNDKLLRQRQHRAPVQSRQSALERRRQGHSDKEDRQRLETIVEDGESPVDDVEARTREYIATQLREGAEDDVRDEPLGTGSFEPEDTEVGVQNSEPFNQNQMGSCNDDVHVDHNDDADDDTDATQAKVAVLCAVVLTHGRRVGQECNRECAPGKTMCKTHLGASTRKK